VYAMFISLIVIIHVVIIVYIYNIFNGSS